MTNQDKLTTAKAKLTAKVKSQSTAMLKTSARLLMNQYTEEAGIAFVFVLNELEERMPEAEYTAFCDSL
jgi:hypothetical protein